MSYSLWPRELYSLPAFSVHGILQARILEWVAIPFSRGSSQSRDWTRISRIAGRFFTVSATREALVTCMLPNSGPTAHLSKATTWETGIGWKTKGYFIQEAGNLGEGGPGSQNYLLRFCLAMNVLKGKRRSNFSWSWDGGQASCHLPLQASSLIPWSLSLEALLFTQSVCELTEGEAGEEIWSSWITYSSF